MAIFMEAKPQDKTPFQQLTPAEQAEIMEKVEAGNQTLSRCLGMLTGAIVAKIKNHGQKLTARELSELADALGHLADTYEALNGGKPSTTESNGSN